MLYGQRGKIGVIAPAPGTATEMEFHKITPDGVAIITTRIPLTIANPENIAKLTDYAEEASVLLAQAEVDLIAFVCTAGSFIKGIGYDKEVTKRIEKRTGLPAITTTTSVIESLKTLKVTKLSLAAPYLNEVTEIEKVFLEDSGFKVTSVNTLNLRAAIKIAKVDSDEIYRLAKETVTEDAQALFISCTGLTVLPIIDAMEKEFKIPVVSSNQATIWAALRKIHIEDKIQGYGRLFSL